MPPVLLAVDGNTADPHLSACSEYTDGNLSPDDDDDDDNQDNDDEHNDDDDDDGDDNVHLRARLEYTNLSSDQCHTCVIIETIIIIFEMSINIIQINNIISRWSLFAMKCF